MQVSSYLQSAAPHHYFRSRAELVAVRGRTANLLLRHGPRRR